MMAKWENFRTRHEQRSKNTKREGYLLKNRNVLKIKFIKSSKVFRKFAGRGSIPSYLISVKAIDWKTDFRN